LAQRVVAAYERNTGRTLFPEERVPDPDSTSQEDPAEEPFNQNVNIATEPTDMPARPKNVDIITADEVFAETSKTAESTKAEDDRRLRNRTLFGALALVALVSAVLTYGWMSTKRG
jgi:hypothetical protein